MEEQKGRVVLIRTLSLIGGIVLAVLWFDVEWWKVWALFGCFAVSATLHLKR